MCAARKARLSSRSRRLAAADRAIRDLLKSLGVETQGEMRQTSKLAATLWTDHLLAGQSVDVEHILGRGSRSTSSAPVTLFDVGVHLVCPHHLTVAFGSAHLAYLPRGRVAGFGALARLIGACTSRLVFQEVATAMIADEVVQQLDARAAVVVIDAKHPCHNVTHPRSHKARAVTWGEAGVATGIKEIKGLLRGRVSSMGGGRA